MFSNAIAAEQKTANWLDKPISISFQNEPLNKVLKKISEQTGVSIAYDQKLKNEKVTGEYQNIKTTDAITRLLRSKNISIEVNNEKKIIVIKTFGAKDFIWANFNKSLNNSLVIGLAELNELNTQQYKEYNERVVNDNELLPEFGMTRGELRSMQEKQYKEYNERIANDDELLPEFGMTRGELRSMQERQHKEYKKRTANENKLLPELNMTQGELRKMQEKQHKDYQNTTPPLLLEKN